MTLIDKLFNAALPIAARAYNKGERGKAGYEPFYNHVNLVRREGGTCGACIKRARRIASEAYLLKQLG